MGELIGDPEFPDFLFDAAQASIKGVNHKNSDEKSTQRDCRVGQEHQLRLLLDLLGC
jgi:hypothetical protein